MGTKFEAQTGIINPLVEQTARVMVERGYKDMGFIINAVAHYINHLNGQDTTEIIEVIYAEAEALGKMQKMSQAV